MIESSKIVVWNVDNNENDDNENDDQINDFLWKTMLKAFKRVSLKSLDDWFVTN